jgi:predicted nucleotide-binding protein (sugar kinase/HSP70/actin superfamily)
MDSKELTKLKNVFKNLLRDFNGIGTYQDKHKNLTDFKNYYDKAKEQRLFTEHQEKIVDALFHNLEIQILNIFKQTNSIEEFFDVLIKLSEKPDDKESLEKIVEYAKSLGI